MSGAAAPAVPGVWLTPPRSWETVLTVMVWASVLTNTLIFGFGSEQSSTWFPWLFDANEVRARGPWRARGLTPRVRAAQEVRMGQGRVLVGLLWVIEHGLIAAGLAITHLVPEVPGRVRVVSRRARAAVALARPGRSRSGAQLLAKRRFEEEKEARSARRQRLLEARAASAGAKAQ